MNKVCVLLIITFSVIGLSGCMSFGDKYRWPREKAIASGSVADQRRSNDGECKIITAFTEYEEFHSGIDKSILIIGVKYVDQQGNTDVEYVAFLGDRLIKQKFGEKAP